MDVATPAATRLEIRRRFRAAPADVYAAWTQPDQMRHWMAPSDAYRESDVTADLRVGGRYRIVMHPPEGDPHRVGGTFVEIVPGRRIVYTWAWESAPDHESLVTIEFRPAGEGTELVLVHDRLADADSRDRHLQGWSGCLPRLERLLDRQAAASGRSVAT